MLVHEGGHPTPTSLGSWDSMESSHQDVTGTPIARGVDLLEAQCDMAEDPG